MPEQAKPVEPKRIFLALWPDEVVRQQLHARQQALKHEPALRDARAVTVDNLHMTLHFIGPLADEVVQQLAVALDVVQAEAFEMQVDIAGYFPRPKVFWLGLAQVSSALQALVQHTAVAVQQCVEAYEYSSFHPHITLFRKAKKPAELAPMPAILWPVTGFALVESKPLPEGVRYVVLKQWRLSA